MVLPPLILDYDLDRFDFRSEVAKLLGVASLEQLHLKGEVPLRNRFNDQNTKYHRAYYRSSAQMKLLYKLFIEHFVSALFTESFCVQTVPTFRVHLPNNLAVGEFHCDKDYNHAVGEINFWVPLTPCSDSNSIWIEQEIGTENYNPISAKPGQVVIFDAVRLRHGNVLNRTGTTRVSFDFRCLPLSLYEYRDARTVNTGARLVLGDYFSLFTNHTKNHTNLTVSLECAREAIRRAMLGTSDYEQNSVAAKYRISTACST